jgi:hypothetical protein
VARRSIFRTRVPPERILIESDHGWDDPPAAIPCRVEWVEHLLSVQLGCPRQEIRALAWRNFARIVAEAGIESLLPPALVEELPGSSATEAEPTLF